VKTWFDCFSGIGGHVIPSILLPPLFGVVLENRMPEYSLANQNTSLVFMLSINQAHKTQALP